MSDLSLGIIEIIGLAGAIEAADVCLKSADVKLVGYEMTKGDGMAVIKIEGNVGDVKAAIEASTAAMSISGKVFGYKIIPRPSKELRFLIRNKDTVGVEESSENLKNHKPDNLSSDMVFEKIEQVDNSDKNNVLVTEKEIYDQPQLSFEEAANNFDIVNDGADLNQKNDEIYFNTEIEENNANDNIDINGDNENKYTCNLCKDPKCPREKGELRSTCIHYNSNEDSIT